MNSKKIFFLSILIICMCMVIGPVSAIDDYDDGYLSSSDLDSNLIAVSSSEENISSCDSEPYALYDDVNSNTELSSVSTNSVSDLSEESTNYTIYFNVNAASDGDGTFENPYKEFSFSKLKSNCSAFFYNGVYNLNEDSIKFDNLSSVTLSGEDSNNVIIGYNGTNVFKFDDFTISDLTLKGFYISVKSRFNGTNVIFRDSVAPNLIGDDSYGGVICSIYSVELFLTNCSFINNSAKYGGVISCWNSPMSLIVVNSKFINNSGVYGGAIYSKGGDGMVINMTILDSEFMNNSAKYGGAIYLDTNVTGIIKGSKFLNNSASEFGGSISLSRCSLDLNDSEFENSCSELGAGGAIYLIRSNGNLNNIAFNNCSSEFGGSLCSLLTNLTMKESRFRNSHAKYSGGAVYVEYDPIIINSSEFSNCSSIRGGAIFIDSCDSFTLSNSKFINNNASYGMDLFFNENPVFNNINNVFVNNNTIHNQSEFELPCIDDNSTVIVNNNIIVKDLPDKYDLREKGYLTPIKNQFDGEDCWSFAAVAAIESAILKATNGTQSYIFSEENLKNLMRVYSDYGWPFDFDSGAIAPMAIAYLAGWLGPVYDIDDKYSDLSVLSPVLSPIIHVSNIICADLDDKDHAIKESIKYLILNYGAVSTVYCHNDSYYNEDTHSYYYNYDDDINHAVAIVGWDDNYSKDNFIITPPGDGAWIIRNSWGSSFGDNGYFYISYYDTSFSHSYNKNLDNYVIVLKDSNNYTKNYQYDLGVTDWITSGNNTIWYKNTFTSKGDDLLAAFSTYFKAKTNYTAYIYINDVLTLNQSGYVDYMGYHTIQLNDLISIKNGDKFSIVIQVDNAKGGKFPIFENYSSNRDYFVANVSFFSYDGVNWIDLHDYRGHNGESEAVKSASLACIKAFTIHNSSSNPLINLSVNDVFYKDDVILNISTDSNINDKISINVNNEEYVLDLVNGFATLKLSNLSIGSYDVIAKLNTSLNILASSSFNVKSTTSISASNLKVPAYTSKYIIATLKDVNGNVLSGKKVKFTVGGKNYTVTTNSKGQAKVLFKSNVTKVHNVRIYFAGEGAYLGSSKSIEVTVVPAYVTVSNIIKAARSLKSYSVKNKKLPATITVGSYKLTHPQLSYLMAVAIKHIKSGKKLNTKVKVINVKATQYNAKVSKKIYKKGYLSIVNSLYKKGVKGTLPKYVTYAGKKIAYNPYTYSISKILAFYNSKKKLPKYCVFTNY
ncbi:MAG: lectin like domain-containing protein [archaeon]|nr:lectin like domain-containing protein [archaeon]